MNKTRDILLRGVDRRMLKEIDIKVAQINNSKKTRKEKTITRNKYLVSLINNELQHDLLEYQETKFDKKLDQLLDLEEEYLRAVNRVIYLLTTGEVTEGVNLMTELGE